eukprot:5570707-Pyramimonas_sp.AAC.1
MPLQHCGSVMFDIPALHVSDWSVVGICPRLVRPIGAVLQADAAEGGQQRDDGARGGRRQQGGVAEPVSGGARGGQAQRGRGERARPGESNSK